MRRRTLLSGLAAALPVGFAGCAGTGDGNGDGGGDADGDGSGSGDGGGGGGGTATEATAEGETSTPAGTPTTVDSPTMETTAGGETESVDGDGGAGATEMATPTPTSTPAPVAQVVDVAADGEFKFAPGSFEIAVGDTVRWVWQGGGHNVRPNETPSGADWSGTPGGDSETYDPGYEYEYTFEVAGEYSYYCAPHRDFGMTGSFTVTE